MELYQFFWLNQQKKHLTEIIQNAENLTFGSGTANHAPAHPLRRGPPLLSDFFFYKHPFFQLSLGVLSREPILSLKHA